MIAKIISSLFGDLLTLALVSLGKDYGEGVALTPTTVNGLPLITSDFDAVPGCPQLALGVALLDVDVDGDGGVDTPEIHAGRAERLAEARAALVPVSDPADVIAPGGAGGAGGVSAVAQDLVVVDHPATAVEVDPDLAAEDLAEGELAEGEALGVELADLGRPEDEQDLHELAAAVALDRAPDQAGRDPDAPELVVLGAGVDEVDRVAVLGQLLGAVEAEAGAEALGAPLALGLSWLGQEGSGHLEEGADHGEHQGDGAGGFSAQC